jgi:hypothetical protein
MKIRTLDDLENILDSELAWRKKEMTLAINHFLSSTSDLSKQYNLRGALLLIYAHWEGYIKKASEAYLDYVISQRMTYALLKSNFLAVGLTNHVENASDTKSIKNKKNIIDFVLNDLSTTKFYGKSNEMVFAESNLNIEILEKICLSIGIDSTILSADKHWIDNRLLQFRNKAAHGDRIFPNEIDFKIEDLKYEIQTILDKYRNLISNAAVTKYYLK